MASYCQRVNPGVVNRVVESARGVLNSYLPDVYIYTDWIKGQSRYVIEMYMYQELHCITHCVIHVYAVAKVVARCS